MKKDTIQIADPEDVARSRAWAAERSAAATALARARARRAVLADNLSRDPAVATLTALRAAETATAAAQDAQARAEATRANAVTAAARYEANELATAQQQLDAATRAVADALALLLTEASTSTALTATVDGLALRTRYQAAIAATPPLWNVATIPFRAAPGDAPIDPELAFPAPSDPDHQPLLGVLAQLDDRVDAIADLVTAESVHQLVNGNPTRSGAALDIAATGSVPDELEVIRTPRPGHDLTHRVLVVTPAETAAAWGEPGVPATADPRLAAWVAALLPDPARVRLGDDGAAAGLTADALGLDPLAWLRVAADPAELAARIARAAAAPGRAEAELELDDLLAAAGAVRAVLDTARALGPDDLDAQLTPEAVEAVLTNVAAAEERVAATLDALERAAGADALLDALLEAAALGIAEAVPALGDGVPAPAALRAQADAALARLRARTAGDPVGPVDGAPAATLTRARERVQALTGSRQPLLVELAAPSDPLVRGDLSAGPVRLQGATPEALRAWLHDHARVRPAVAALQRAYDIAEALDCPATLALRAAQSPSADPDAWVESDPEPPHGTVNLVVVRAYDDALPDAVSGLAIDAWTSTVPAATHATALAFHYDEPDATPPQAILVAVAPDTGPDRRPAAWDLDTLLDVVRSTFALAAERAVAADLDPDASVSLP